MPRATALVTLASGTRRSHFRRASRPASPADKAITIGWAGSMASSAFGGDLPAALEHVMSVTASTTYYVYAGVGTVNYNCTNQSGVLRSITAVASLHQSTGL